MTISVCIFKRAGRKHYEAQWSDPETGRKKTRSTRCERKRDAERYAGNIEKELRSGTFREPQRTTWADFRERFETEQLATKAQSTREHYAGTFNLIEQLVRPGTLASLNESAISRFAAKFREMGREEPTIKGRLSDIRSMLNWAHRQRLIASVPAIEMPKTSGTTGRPVTSEEFERMLDKVTDVVGTECADSWTHLLRGLWFSGLRLGEAMALSWDDDRLMSVDISGKRPMFHIRARGQKNRKDSLTPIAPEFYEMLLSVPEDERTGFVFNPTLERRQEGRQRMRKDTTSKVIRRIGKRATAKIGEYLKSGKTKYAGAHDLRRSFGFRWAMRVLPPVLRELMRHASVDTTMRYYVGRNADAAADAVWDAFTNSSSNTAPETSLTADVSADANLSGFCA